MKFKETKIASVGMGKWIVEIDGKEWKDILKKAKNKVISNLEVPGFRKGKVPANQAEKYVTPSKVYNEAYRLSVSPAFDFARAQNPKIEPLNPPTPVPTKVSENTLIIEFNFELKPEIKLGQYTNIKSVAKSTPEITVEEVDATINQYCEQFVMEKTKSKDEKVAEGDAVIFDFEGFMDGKAFKGGEAKDHKLVIGSKLFIPGFEASMIGLGLGKSEIEVIFPEDYAEELAGKKAIFKLNITEIKQREIPAKDDELVKDLNIQGVTTFKQLEDKVKKDILSKKEANLKNEFVEKIIDEIVKNSIIELPKSVIEKQVDDLKKEFEDKLKQQNMDLKQYKKMTGLTDKQIHDELQADAKSRLETFLVTSEIKAKEKFDVTEEMLNEKYASFANQFSMEVEQIKSMVNPDMLKNEIINDLIVKFLYENNG